MQLISTLLLLLSLAMFVGALLFVARWHRTYRNTSVVPILHEDIAHIGVSAVVSYPETARPLVALLEEEYPRSEAIVITDLESKGSSLVELVGRYNLVEVNHDHLAGVRRLYRSRRRAFRRVVVVDLPVKHRERSAVVAREVASYDNILYLQGESIVEPNVVEYCANVVASQRSSSSLLLRSIVGADAHLERGDEADDAQRCRLRANRPLAWQRVSLSSVIVLLLVPMLAVPMAILSQSWLLLIAAEVVVAVELLCLVVSSRVESEKSLVVRLVTVFQNIYRFWSRRRATRPASRTPDTAPSLVRERVQSRPARYHEDARQGR